MELKEITDSSRIARYSIVVTREDQGSEQPKILAYFLSHPFSLNTNRFSFLRGFLIMSHRVGPSAILLSAAV